MMRPVRSPFWAAVIRVMRGSDDMICMGALLNAFMLFAMMALRMLVAWQTGEWQP